MSPEMVMAEPGIPSLVDLYWNDLYASLKSAEDIADKKASKPPSPTIKCDEDPEEALIRRLYFLTNA